MTDYKQLEARISRNGRRPVVMGVDLASGPDQTVIAVTGRQAGQPNIQYLLPPVTPDIQQMVDDIKAAMASQCGIDAAALFKLSDKPSGRASS